MQYQYPYGHTVPISSPTGEYPHILPTPDHLEQKQGKNYCRYCRTSYSQRAMIANFGYCWICARALSFMLFGVTHYKKLPDEALKAYLSLPPEQWRQDYETYTHRMANPTPEDIAEAKAWDERIARLNLRRELTKQRAISPQT
jgi:ribosomal protein S14